MSFLDWARTLEDDTARGVARTPLPDGGEVSTVWLGLDHRFRGDGPPLIFETLVFDARGHAWAQWRWATEAEARAGHARVVQQRWEGAPEVEHAP